jgi:beta-galactosidase
MQELVLKILESWPSVAATANEADWKPAFRGNRGDDWKVYKDSLIALRGSFELADLTNETIVNLFSKSIVENQTIYINGHLLASNLKRLDSQSFKLDNSTIKKGKNEYVVVGKRFKKRSEWDEVNTNPGVVQVIVPAEPWKRKAFNGLAQVIVQASKQSGEIKLKATSPGLTGSEIVIKAESATIRPVVDSK